jgi:hypothetical protein
MLAKLIGMFVTLMVLWTLYTPLSQQIKDIVECNSSLISNSSIDNITYEVPPGATQSFGGAGGTYRFGGYTGELTHRDFNKPTVIYNNNSLRLVNIEGIDCTQLTDNQKTFLSWVPTIFLIMGLFFVLYTTWHIYDVFWRDESYEF